MRSTRNFESAYRRRFAFTMPGVPLIVESLSVESIGRSGGSDAMVAAPEALEPARAVRMATAHMAGRAQATPIYDRATLPAGQRIDGPAVIFDAASTTVVEPGWAAAHSASGDLILNRVEARASQTASADADPVRLEIYNNLFMSIAEQMGLALQNTAYSVNIKERLDFSCALFDADGALIANAPHMPVHLGSMGESVRAALCRSAQPG